MKFLFAFALIAVASAAALPLTPAQTAEVQQIVDAIYSPSLDATTAAHLEQMLADYLSLAGIAPSDVLPGYTPVQQPALLPAPILGPGFETIQEPALLPAPILGPGFETIQEPALLPAPILGPGFETIQTPVLLPAPILGPGFEVIDGEVPSPGPIVGPSPIVAPQPASGGPLVQIILNVRQASDVAVSPVVPSPVQIIDFPEIAPSPVQIVDFPEVAPTPVQIVDFPTIVPVPIVNLPEILN